MMDTSAILCSICKDAVRFDRKMGYWYHRMPPKGHRAQPDFTEWVRYSPEWFAPEIPDLTPLDSSGLIVICPAQHPYGPVCTRLLDHTGRHAAGNGENIIAVWGECYVKPERVKIAQIVQTAKWPAFGTHDYYTALIHMYVDFIEAWSLGSEFNAYAKTYTPRLD